MSACNTLVWLISYENCGEQISSVHTHNAIADYRDIDPNATVKRIDCAAVAELINAAELARTELKRQHAYSSGAEAGSIWRALQATETALSRVTGGA